MAKKYTEDTIKGEGAIKGKDGDSAYQIAVKNGFSGTEAEWLASLKGADGKDGNDGINGTDGTDGAKGDPGEKGEKGDKGDKGDTPDLTEVNEKIDNLDEKVNNVQTTSKIDINSDTELLAWLRNHPYKQALLYLQYKSDAIGLDEGEFEFFGSRDAGIAKGIFRETYSKSTAYYIEFDLSNTTSLLLRTKVELATIDKVANDFRKTVITNVTGIANGDVAIIPPSGASNYIPINAKPLGTWNTMPILFYNTSDKQYYLHSAGLDVQEYEVEWITS